MWLFPRDNVCPPEDDDDAQELSEGDRISITERKGKT